MASWTGAPFWLFVTRLGEAQILLPAAALAVWALLRREDGRRLVVMWLGLLLAAVLLTAATKVAFIGWGVGLPQIDFTGISGHAMFAAAVYPLLLGTLMPGHVPALRWVGLGAGALLALVVGLSRIELHAHSASETVAGLALGAAVSVGALLRAGLVQGRIGRWAPIVAAAWLAFVPLHAPAWQGHTLVTKIALKLSGRAWPYMREPWLQEWRARQPRL